MAAPFTSECWPTREFLCADEPHPSHQSSSLPLHSNEQQRVDHGLLQPGFETPNLSSGVGNYPSPSPAEQGALSVLKGYPDHLLAIWFDLARQDRFVPPNAHTTSSLPVLRPASPLAQFQQNYELEASTNIMTHDGPYGPLGYPPLKQSYGFDQAQELLFRSPQIQQSLSAPNLVQPSTLYPFSNSMSYPQSMPRGNSPTSSSGTPLHIASSPATSFNIGTDNRSPKLGARSLSTLSGYGQRRRLRISQESKKSSLPYSCTFCDSQSTFKSKNEWKRHERSHVPQVEYICLPEGGVIPSDDGRSVCAICELTEPRADHMVKHRMHLCLYKSLEDRTYHRKDKFIKHLKSVFRKSAVIGTCNQTLPQRRKAESNYILRVHGLGLESPQAKLWSRQLPERTLGCGFCVQYFETFEERSQHVATHFEQGSRKKSWSGSTVILSLLNQPFISSDWQSLRREISDLYTISDISWPESSSTDSLQRRLECGTESGRDLAIAAYNLSSLCAGDVNMTGPNEGMEALQYPIGSIDSLADLEFFRTDMV